MKLLLLSDHGPSARSIVPEYEGNDLNPCFVSDLPITFFERPALWIHGHVHSSVDYRNGGTRVVTNPRGYRRRSGAFGNGAFRHDLVIEVQP